MAGKTPPKFIGEDLNQVIQLKNLRKVDYIPVINYGMANSVLMKATAVLVLNLPSSIASNVIMMCSMTDSDTI